MKINVNIRCLLCGFVLSFNSFAQNNLLGEIDEFITDYTKLSKQLITNLNCNEYQNIFDKSQWVRYKEFIFGKPKDVCCAINDPQIFDSTLDDYERVRKKSLVLQYELSKRLAFDELCNLNILNAKLLTSNNRAFDLLKCKNSIGCNLTKKDKLISRCQTSIHSLNKSLFKDSLISKVESCLRTNLIKPVVEGANTIKKPISPLNPNFNELFFDGLNELINKVHKDIAFIDFDEINKLAVKLSDELSNLWSLQISNSKSFNIKGENKTNPICKTIGLFSNLSLINIISKTAKECLNDNECSKDKLNRMIGELVKEKNKLVELYVDNQEFKNCMQETLIQNT